MTAVILKAEFCLTCCLYKSKQPLQFGIVDVYWLSVRGQLYEGNSNIQNIECFLYLRHFFPQKVGIWMLKIAHFHFYYDICASAQTIPPTVNLEMIAGV